MHMIRVEHAAASPTCCIYCQSPKGPFVDAGREVPMVGRVYLCEQCIGEASGLFGMLTARDAGKLQANVRTLDAEVRALTVKLGMFESVQATVDTAVKRILEEDVMDMVDGELEKAEVN